MKKATRLKLILLTPVFIIFSHYFAVFPHEYAHSFMAWILGYKSNPLQLNYGGTSWNNLLLLSNINENVNYRQILNDGHFFYVALIAFSGAWIANLLLFILSLYLLKQKTVKQKPYIFYFTFWFNLMNLGNFYDYVPMRTFANYGDIYGIVVGLNISPWWIYIMVGYLVAFLIWHFFTSTLISAYKNFEISSTPLRAGLMITSVLILFGFFSGIIGISLSPDPKNFNIDVSHFLSLTSFLMIPGVVLACWPTRAWVSRLLPVR
jgi:hypothetical protein